MEVSMMKKSVSITHLRRALTIPGILLAVLLLQAFQVSAAPPGTYPSPIPLPDGFRPEGIAVGRGDAFFVGSIPTGAIYRGDLRTGQGEILVPPQEGRAAIGLSVDERTNYLFVAGGGTGNGYVYDAATGATVSIYSLTAPGTFVNDVIVTRDAAYFTDSFRPYLYRLPLSAGGALPDPAAVQEIALGGDFVSVPGFNTNGIDATPNGKWLVIVHSTRGELYRVDPETGHATLINLDGSDVTRGDGLLLDGKTLYVVQNRLNQIAVVRLNPQLTAGDITGYITDPDFDVPTTIAEFGSRLYAVNARFGTPDPDTLSYDVVKVSKR
jgi:sugar lactone lactonase YvrE